MKSSSTKSTTLNSKRLGHAAFGPWENIGKKNREIFVELQLVGL